MRRFFIGVIFVCTLCFASLVNGQTSLVIGNGTPASCTETALNQAIAAGGLITFNCGGAVTINFTSTKSILSASPDVTIDGGGQVTFNGTNEGVSRRLFRISIGRTVKLHNLKLQNGVVELDGGAIENRGTLEIYNSILSSNGATGANGGAIANVGIVNIIKTTFMGNSADRSGGAIYNDGGTVNISGSTFIGNSSGDDGGAIFANGGHDQQTIVNIVNSTFVGNSADNGGAIYVFSSNLRVNITHATFSQNSASQSASALGENLEGLIYVRNSIFTAPQISSHCSPGIVEAEPFTNVVHGLTCTGIANPASTADPKLGTLQGSPAYFPLNTGSPAINVAATCTYLSSGTNPLFSNGAPVQIDQRWYARPANTTCDAGSYEADAVPAVLTVTPTPSITPTPTKTSQFTATPLPSDTPEGTPTDTPESTEVTGTPDTSTPTLETSATGTPDAMTPAETPDGTNTSTSAVTPTPQSTVEGTFTATPSVSGQELLLNGSFETATDKVPDGWSQKKASGDKQKCNKEGKPAIAFDGQCVYQFKSAPGENSVLAQNVDINAVQANDTITLGGVYTAKGSVNAKVKVRVKYTDTNLQKGKLNVTIDAQAAAYTAFTGTLSLTLTGEPQSIKVQLQNKGTSGKVRFDAVSLIKAEVNPLAMP